MKQRVVQEIQKFVADYQKNRNCLTEWGEALVGFAEKLSASRLPAHFCR